MIVKNEWKNASCLGGQGLPTYVQESLHQADMARIPQGEAQAIARHMTHYHGPEDVQ